jgi:thiamine-monophosphate kinase
VTEFERIRAIERALGTRARGLGDDCAVLPTVAGSLVLSTDTSVQDVHFRLDWLGLREIGWRASAAALSDLAAGGAEPLGLLAAVAMPRQSSESDVVELMLGVADAGESVGASVLGGDLSAAEAWIVTITVIGRAERVIGRAGALPGDGIWVTGALGGSRAAVEAWRAGTQPGPSARRAFAAPAPRIAAGRWLAARGARAMLDISDGLAGDALHLATASGVGIELELDAIPVAPDVAEEARRLGVTAEEMAAVGGEDYELLVALGHEFGPQDAAAFEVATRLPLTRIGSVTEGAGVRATLRGRPVQIRGYDHFR